jgi:hypothetical protein
MTTHAVDHDHAHTHPAMSCQWEFRWEDVDLTCDNAAVVGAVLCAEHLPHVDEPLTA